MEAGAIISGLVVIASALLKWYLGRDKTYENVQRGREDIKVHDADAVTARVDRLLVGSGDSPSAVSSRVDRERQLRSLLGVDTDGLSNGGTLGKSGKV